MKKVLIAISVALFAAVCVLNVNLLTKNNSTKVAQIVSLNKALATPENPDQEGYITSEMDCPPKKVPIGDQPGVPGGKQTICLADTRFTDDGCVETSCGD